MLEAHREAIMALDAQTAKQFFANLYEDNPAIPNTPNFDKMVTKLVSTLGPNVSTGDQALQAMMFNYILSDPANAKKGQELASVLGNIKQLAVSEFVKAFPNANLNELISAAKKAGYDVEVMKA
jgi:hypothetical protein